VYRTRLGPPAAAPRPLRNVAVLACPQSGRHQWPTGPAPWWRSQAGNKAWSCRSAAPFPNVKPGPGAASRLVCFRSSWPSPAVQPWWHSASRLAGALALALRGVSVVPNAAHCLYPPRAVEPAGALPWAQSTASTSAATSLPRHRHRSQQPSCSPLAIEPPLCALARSSLNRALALPGASGLSDRRLVQAAIAAPSSVRGVVRRRRNPQC
jgi:hypothetical protein